MPTCREIVNGALRKIGRLGAGRDPRQADFDDTFQSLMDYYDALITAGTLGRLRDVVPVTAYVARENERVFRQNDSCTSVDLPLTVEDYPVCGDPCDYGSRWVPPGNTTAQGQRPPRDCAVIVISDAFSGVTGEFIYSGHTHEWQSVYDLQPDSYAPLSHRDADGLKCALARRVADEFGAEMMPATARQASLFESNLAMRWSFPRQRILQEYF